MSRKAEIRNAHRYLGKEATFCDGMITCSTLPGKAICRVVWNMGVEENARFVVQNLEMMIEKGPPLTVVDGGLFRLSVVRNIK